MAELFDRDVKIIGKHINNVLKEELDNHSTWCNYVKNAALGTFWVH